MREGSLDHRGVTAHDVNDTVTTIIRLRAEGLSYSAIAAQVGWGVGRVRSALQEAAKSILTDRDAYFSTMVASALWIKRRLLLPYIENERVPLPHQVATAALKADERLSKLLGLDQPLKVEGRFDFGGKTTEELAALAIANGMTLPPSLADEIPEPEEDPE